MANETATVKKKGRNARKREKASFDVLQHIDDMRMSRGWTEYALAKNSGLTQSTVSTWYRKRLEPAVSSIEKICSGFGISLSQFFSAGEPDDGFTEEQREIFALWSRLSPEQRSALKELILTMLPEVPDDVFKKG